jgi:hypothetical protein
MSWVIIDMTGVGEAAEESGRAKLKLRGELSHPPCHGALTKDTV